MHTSLRYLVKFLI